MGYLVVNELGNLEFYNFDFVGDVADTTPNPFSFTDQTNVNPAALTQSNSITVSGIDASAAISISGPGGEYRINGGSWVSAPGTVDNGDTVEVRNTSGTYLAVVNTTLTIGGESDVFSLTTRNSDTTPNAFGFTDASDVGLSSVITSNTVTISGLLDAASVSVDVGELSIDGGAFESGPTTITNGQTLAVRHTSSGSNAAAINQTVNVGGITDIFTSTTVVADPAPSVVLSVVAGIKNGTFDVTATFSKDVTGLLLASLVVVGGTALSLTPVSASVYTFSISPSAVSQGNLTVDLAADSAIDGAAQGNTAATQLVVQYDTLAPTVVLSTASGTKTGQFTVDVSFPEAVTGLADTDFSITGGTIASLSGSGAAYTLTIDPTADDAGDLLLQLLAATVVDAGGNVNAASSILTVAYDTLVDDTPVAVDAAFSIPENAPVGTAVGTVEATDVDTTALVYSITAGNSEGKFAIDAATGVITIAVALDYSVTTSYSLTVDVSDGNTSDTATIAITIIDYDVDTDQSSVELLFPEIRADFPTLSYDLLLHYAREVAIQFCEETWYWKETISNIDLLSYQDTYRITPTSGIVTDIEEVQVTDSSGTVQTLVREQHDDFWYYNQVAPDIIQLPEIAKMYPGPMTVRVALRPARNSVQIPEPVYEHHYRCLCDGIRAKILMMKRQDWFNQREANDYTEMFEGGMARARLEVARQYSKQPRRVTSRKRNFF